jgi:hypothetical protein
MECLFTKRGFTLEKCKTGPCCCLLFALAAMEQPPSLASSGCGKDSVCVLEAGGCVRRILWNVVHRHGKSSGLPEEQSQGYEGRRFVHPCTSRFSVSNVGVNRATYTRSRTHIRGRGCREVVESGGWYGQRAELRGGLCSHMQGEGVVPGSGSCCLHLTSLSDAQTRR